MMKNIKISCFLYPFFFALILFSGCGNSDREKNLRQASYNMVMENSKGERVSMEQFRGRVIFMNVWATWCAPCVKEMPTIQNLFEEIDRNRVVFIMLSMDQEFEKAIEYRENYKYDFEIYRLIGPMPAIYHTKLIPTTFVINSEGKLVLQHDGMGEFDSPEFKKFLAGVK
jgi:thiol-disulfide isomerase/thioredoxin